MIYKFVHQSTEHYDWWNNKRRLGDLIYITFTDDNTPPVWIKVLSLTGNNSNIITSEINEWLEENQLTYPFRTTEDEMLFKLRFA